MELRFDVEVGRTIREAGVASPSSRSLRWVLNATLEDEDETHEWYHGLEEWADQPTQQQVQAAVDEWRLLIQESRALTEGIE